MEKLTPLLLLLFAASVTSSISCGPRRVVVNGKEMTYEEGATHVYEEGQRAKQTGDTATAKVRFQEVADHFEDSARSADALSDLTEILLEEGGCRSARLYLERLAEQHPLSPQAAKAKETLARCDGEKTEREGPLATFTTQYQRASSDGERKDVASSAADAAIAAGDFEAAVRWLLRVLAQETNDAQKGAIKAEVAELIDARVSFQEVRELLEGIGGNDFPKDLLTYKLGRIQYHVRDLSNASETLQRYLSTWPGGSNEAGAKSLLALIAARSNVKPHTIGVVLPLSGKNRGYGENALQAIQLAIGDGDADKKKSSSSLQLVVRDTKSERASAAQAVQDLALEDGAIAIVGPMFTNEAQPAGYKAQELGIPLMTISAADDIAVIGPYVFRNGLTNQAQAKALVRYAMDVAGMKTFAILYPRHPYGEELLHLFWDEVEKRKGEIRGVESYGTEDTTFASQVKSLVARDVLGLRSDYKKALEECDKQPDNFRRERCKGKVKDGLKPIVDFDGLFIPDYPRTISMISAALAFEDIIVETDPKYLKKIEKTLDRKVTPVTLLGASGWNSSELPEKAERNVENAIFTDAFFAGSDDKMTVEFVSAFQKKYKRTPTVVEALAYDSARIVRQVLEASQPTTREAMREALRHVNAFPGVTGRTSFVSGTDAQKEVRILTIKNGVIQEVSLPENRSATEEPGDPGVPASPGGTR